jgi:hypothetical protein
MAAFDSTQMRTIDLNMPPASLPAPIPFLVNQLILGQAVTDFAEKVELWMEEGVGFRVTYIIDGKRCDYPDPPKNLYLATMKVVYANIGNWSGEPIRGEFRTQPPDVHWSLKADRLTKVELSIAREIVPETKRARLEASELRKLNAAIEAQRQADALKNGICYPITRQSDRTSEEELAKMNTSRKAQQLVHRLEELARSTERQQPTVN